MLPTYVCAAFPIYRLRSESDFAGYSPGFKQYRSLTNPVTEKNKEIQPIIYVAFCVTCHGICQRINNITFISDKKKSEILNTRILLSVLTIVSNCKNKIIRPQ